MIDSAGVRVDIAALRMFGRSLMSASTPFRSMTVCARYPLPLMTAAASVAIWLVVAVVRFWSLIAVCFSVALVRPLAT